MSNGISPPPALGDDALSGAIGKILEHPELISMVASVLGTDGTEKAAEQQTQKGEAVKNDGETSQKTDADTAAILPVLSKLSALGVGKDGEKKGSAFKHEQLLCALKPYLSKNRCDAIDYVLRISKISSVIGQLR